MVCDDKSKLWMSANHDGFCCRKSLIIPVMFSPMSPVVELIFRLGTLSDSPFPLNSADSDRVLWKVFSEGNKQAKSARVIVEGLMLP